MADRKATNKYYPPQWTPEQGSLNTFLGSHPLRDRARKLDQGIMIIRFELPYNIWCGGCGAHVGMGVRYNAQKTTVGRYYSTPIFKFRMKCHLCDNHFEIQTDPKNMDYVVVSGASRKNEKWEHSEGETVSVEGKSEAEKLATDPMYRLEHNVGDKRKAEDSAPRIARIMEMQQDTLDDFSINQLLRKKFRDEKKVLKTKEEEETKIKERANLFIPLVEEHTADVKTAKRTEFTSGSSKDEKRKKRLEIKTQSLFESTAGRSKASSSFDRMSKGQRSSKGGEGRDKARQVLLKACGRMDSSIFSRSPSSGRGNSTSNGGRGSSSSTEGKRKMLGVRTSKTNATM